MSTLTGDIIKLRRHFKILFLTILKELKKDCNKLKRTRPMDSEERFPDKYYYKKRPLPEDFKYCSDCGIIRTNEPKPGTCPCCFSEMVDKIGYGGISLKICTNEPCKLCITTDKLGGFWHGWKERERLLKSEGK